MGRTTAGRAAPRRIEKSVMDRGDRINLPGLENPNADSWVEMPRGGGCPWLLEGPETSVCRARNRNNLRILLHTDSWRAIRSRRNNHAVNTDLIAPAAYLNEFAELIPDQGRRCEHLSASVSHPIRRRPL